MAIIVCPKCDTLNKADLQLVGNKKPVCGKCSNDIPLHGLVNEVSEAGLRKLIQKSDLPLLVDFWAPWCGPCRQFAPVFETTSKQFPNKVTFVKLNTEYAPALSNELGIRSIPSLLLFKNGKEINRVSGSLPEQNLKQFILQNAS